MTYTTAQLESKKNKIIERVLVLSPCLLLCRHGNKIDEIRRARQEEFKDFCASTFTEACWHHSIIQSEIKLLQWIWGSYLEPKDYRRACKRGGGCSESKCSKVGNGKRVLSHRVMVLILMCHIINPERIHQWVFLLPFQFLLWGFKKISWQHKQMGLIPKLPFSHICSSTSCSGRKHLKSCLDIYIFCKALILILVTGMRFPCFYWHFSLMLKVKQPETSPCIPRKPER